MKKKPIFVTQPSLPKLKDLDKYLKKIWDSKIISNNGPFHQKLETALCEFLGVPFISLVSNGTIGLIIALKTLNVQGEVITTPYSFVATAHSLLWNNNKPVFVDIDPITLNLDPDKIQKAITAKTSAILPVHVYGHPCDVDKLEEIATRNNLKLIYDASHAFGVECHCGSILNHGDMSVLSFHATKVFNTFEGGAIISKDEKTKKRIDELKNFGFNEETDINGIGINGKMNEFSAALGLLQLKDINRLIKKRKLIDTAYRFGLKNIEGIRIHNLPDTKISNYSYFPIFIDEQYPITRDQLYKKLREKGINTRKYFYPLINDFSIYKRLKYINNNDLIVAYETTRKVLCLPIYSEMLKQDVQRIISVISDI